MGLSTTKDIVVDKPIFDGEESIMFVCKMPESLKGRRKWNRDHEKRVAWIMSCLDCIQQKVAPNAE